MNDLMPVFSCLAIKDQEALNAIVPSLSNAWHKRQVFRTHTEAVISVLNDANFPTNASKYWQCVREQTVMLDNLTITTFDMRRNALALKKAQKRLSEAKDEFDIEEAQIDVDECMFKSASVKQVADDRVREIKMWEQLKNDLNDGSFDTEDVNTHQASSMLYQLENRAKCVTPSTTSAELMNIHGPLETLKKHLNHQLAVKAADDTVKLTS